MPLYCVHRRVTYGFDEYVWAADEYQAEELIDDECPNEDYIDSDTETDLVSDDEIDWVRRNYTIINEEAMEEDGEEEEQ